MDMPATVQEPVPELAAIRARSLFMLIFVAIVLPTTLLSALWPTPVGDDQRLLYESLTASSCYLFLGFILWRLFVEVGLEEWSGFGPRPRGKNLYVLMALAIPLAAISIAGLYTLFLPLSWIAPEFVSSWLLEDDSLTIKWSGGLTAMTGSVLNIITLVFLGPVVEEVLFRGFLLNRWWKKYGLRKAIVLTSLGFALLHVDAIGGLVFGVVMSLIHVKTRSLAAPILVHVSNNTLVVILLLAEGILSGETSETSLAEFQSYWWTAPLGLLIGVPWLRWFYRRYLKDTTGQPQ